MLYQRQDDNVVITLLVGPDAVPTIKEYIYYGDPEPDSTKETLKTKLSKLSSSKSVGSKSKST